MNRTVTVVIATFNRSHLLPKAIDSVLRQTYPSLELIVVDDGSSDRTHEVVQEYGDPRVRYIRHERNKGLPAGRNTGIRAAAGEYTAFIDDDDQWTPDKLEKQLHAIGENDAILCGAIDSSGKRIGHVRARITTDDLRRGNKFPPSGLLAKSSVLKDLLFDEELRQGEDWDAYIRMASRYSIIFIDEPLLLYNSDDQIPRMTNDGKNRSIAELENRMAVIRKHRRFLGPDWFAYHEADTLLSYLRYRQARFSQICYAVRRCGLAAVFGVFLGKVKRRVAT